MVMSSAVMVAEYWATSMLSCESATLIVGFVRLLLLLQAAKTRTGTTAKAPRRISVCILHPPACVMKLEAASPPLVCNVGRRRSPGVKDRLRTPAFDVIWITGECIASKRSSVNVNEPSG
jgi:hypothetical protein